MTLQVEYWKSKVDRQCIERLKNFQNPPMLVGHVMEMVMTLIGKKSISKSTIGGDYPSKDEQSGRYSASSGSTKYTAGKKGESPRARL
jgi:dynein heavy chain